MNTLKKTQFNALVELFGHDAFETVCENNHIYRQITVNGVCCRYATAKLKEVTQEQLNAAMQKERNAALPAKLRESEGAPVSALIYESKNTIYYCLLKGLRAEKAETKRLVERYSMLHLAA